MGTTPQETQVQTKQLAFPVTGISPQALTALGGQFTQAIRGQVAPEQQRFEQAIEAFRFLPQQFRETFERPEESIAGRQFLASSKREQSQATELLRGQSAALTGGRDQFGSRRLQQQLATQFGVGRAQGISQLQLDALQRLGPALQSLVGFQGANLASRQGQAQQGLQFAGQRQPSKTQQQFGINVAGTGGSVAGAQTGSKVGAGDVALAGLGSVVQGAGSTLGVGLGALPFGASDRRLKTNIQRIGTLINGLGVYVFNYIWGGPKQIGVMADEVRKIMPHAVFSVDGFDVVNYAEVLRNA